jgi:hypothetical protein
MIRRHARYLSVFLALAVTIAGCSSSSLTKMASESLFNEVGGMDSVSKLSSSLLGSSAKDSRLSGLLGGGEAAKIQPKLSNQLCAVLGGGCAAPLNHEQISAGAKRVSPEQNTALGEHLGSSLQGMNLSSSVTEAVKKAVAPKLGGIVGALL